MVRRSRSTSLSWMWRRSVLRCTVIPSAPASSARTAAATGSGSRLRRASRIVAMWSTLTPSFTGSIASPRSGILPDLLLDDLFKPRGHLLYRLQRLALHHDAGPGLRAGVADEQPARVSQPHLLVPDRRADARVGIEGRAGAHRNVDQNLRTGPHAGRPAAQVDPSAAEQVEEQEPGEQTVPGGRLLQEDHVSGLLPPQDIAPPLHLLQDVFVADRRPQQADSLLAQRAIEPQVGHDGADDRVAAQSPGRLE